MANKVAWHEVWEKFDVWYQAAEDNLRCGECGHRAYAAPDWPDQQEKIRLLVEASLRKKPKSN